MRPTMAEMLPVPIGLPGSISPHDQALDQARAFAAAEKAKHTVGVYRRGFLAFTEWCAANQACALPATIETTAAHLSALCTSGRSRPSWRAPPRSLTRIG